jgi:hypothetical protein
MISKSLIVGILITIVIVIAVVIVYFMMKSHPSSPRRPNIPKFKLRISGSYLDSNGKQTVPGYISLLSTPPYIYTPEPSAIAYAKTSKNINGALIWTMDSTKTKYITNVNGKVVALAVNSNKWNPVYLADLLDTTATFLTLANRSDSDGNKYTVLSANGGDLTGRAEGVDDELTLYYNMGASLNSITAINA